MNQNWLIRTRDMAKNVKCYRILSENRNFRFFGPDQFPSLMKEHVSNYLEDLCSPISCPPHLFFHFFSNINILRTSFLALVLRRSASFQRSQYFACGMPGNYMSSQAQYFCLLLSCVCSVYVCVCERNSILHNNLVFLYSK